VARSGKRGTRLRPKSSGDAARTRQEINNENNDVKTPYTPIDRFTLSYAPTRGGILDTLGTLLTKLGFDSDPVLAVREQMEYIQSTGQKVNWVAHSRGGADFAQAAAGSSMKDLSNNSVVFHSGANNQAVTDSILSSKQIGKFNGGYRDSPNDLVPQIIGLRALSSPLNFASSLLAAPCVFLCSVKNSPHTLPYNWNNLETTQ
jgi:hypothetical protein